MSKTCQNCNHANLPQAAFCSNCASPLPASGARQQGSQPNFGAPQAGQNFAQPANAAAPGDAASQKATLALILALAGLFCCSVFTTVPAIFLGWTEMNAIKNGHAPKAGLQMAQWGFWIGIGATVIHILGFGFWILLTLLAAASDPYGGY